MSFQDKTVDSGFEGGVQLGLKSNLWLVGASCERVVRKPALLQFALVVSFNSRPYQIAGVNYRIHDKMFKCKVQILVPNKTLFAQNPFRGADFEFIE